jgi:D-alanyl-D-alanine carboxypeptidase (penicillin-binding protein 5/6)
MRTIVTLRKPTDAMTMNRTKLPQSLTHRAAIALLSLCLAAASAIATPALAFETSAKQAIMIDLQTGSVLLEKNADEPVPPSSMSKMMTVYMVFERLKEGTLSLSDTFVVSRKAWKQGGSKMFVEVGKSVSVADLLRGVIVQSGSSLPRAWPGTKRPSPRASTTRPKNSA